MGNSLVKKVFYLVGMLVVAMLLYSLFFVGDDSGVRFVYNNLRQPLGRYYYDYCYKIGSSKTKDADNSLGIEENINRNNLENDADASFDEIDPSKAYRAYSTGWF